MNLTRRKHSPLASMAALFLILVSTLCMRPGYAEQYPLDVLVVEKEHANYDTPENGYAAIMSAMLKEDEQWYYEALSKQSAESERQLHETGGGELQIKFDQVKSISKVQIMDKKPFKEGVILLIKATDKEGSIMEGPSFFVKEDQQWKSQLEVPLDHESLRKIKFTPSE